MSTIVLGSSQFIFPPLKQSLGIPGSLKNAFDRLTSRDPKKFWTSGQWMTERRGGSDVGMCSGVGADVAVRTER